MKLKLYVYQNNKIKSTIKRQMTNWGNNYNILIKD